MVISRAVLWGCPLFFVKCPCGGAIGGGGALRLLLRALLLLEMVIGDPQVSIARFGLSRRAIALSLTLALSSALTSVLPAPVQAQGLAGAYLAGRQAAYQNDYSAAAEYFTRALARDPSNPALLENATIAHLSAGRIDRALPIARKITADGPPSQVAQMVMVLDDIDRGAYGALLQRISEDRAIGPLVDGLVGAWAHLGMGDPRAALAAFDDLASKRGLGGFAAYHKALALASVGDFEGAEALFSDAQNGNMQMTRRGAIAHLSILSQLGRHADALGMLDGLFGPDLDPELRQIQALLQAGQTVPYTTARDAREGMAEVFYTVAGALLNEAADDFTLLYARMAQFLRPTHTDAVLMAANLLENLERYDLAVTAFKSVPRDDPSYHAAEQGRAEALRKDGRIDAAAEVLEQLAETHGDIATVHSSLGDLMRQMKEWEKAAAAYGRALDRYDSADRRQWFVYYARAISYERMGNWPLAEADFRRALELNPEQPQVLNYLGYSLVEKHQKLDEALDMIERAVAARPDSGYIVDSLGWVLYKLGRYSEAVVHMERATELMPVDPVVNDHLGDVYWAVGRKREAQFQWRRALSFVDGSESADDVNPDRIRRKIEAGLDQVLAEEGAPPLKIANDN